MALSVIIPTLGRPTLLAAIESVLAQLEPPDEVIVAADSAGDIEAARSACWHYQVVYLEAPSTVGIGCAQREAAIRHARGDQLAFLDDDDVYLPGALAWMRGAACDRPVIFRMIHPLLGILWREPTLAYGNVSSQMLLVPNRPGRLGTWEPLVGRRGSDYVFIRGCIEKMGAPVWREEIIAELSPAGVAAGSHVMGTPA